MPSARKPLIGLTLDSEESGGWSDYPWYALRQNYCRAVAEAGGAPVCLPHEPELAAEYLDVLSGLIVTGGAFDVNPALFGAGERHASVTTKEARTRFEWAVLQGALDRDMPILGICGGEQLLNVILGGTLIQHIPDEIANALPHEVKPKGAPAHTVMVKEGTLLYRITGGREFAVNTSHHQAVGTPGKGVILSASAPDGVVEAIELPSRRFCLGLQWHPEFFTVPADRKILEAFVSACAR